MKKIITLLIFLSAHTIAVGNYKEFTVMHGPGGVSDLTTRYIANNLPKNYIVTNRPGASGRIAINHMLKNNTFMLATMVQVFVTNPLNFNDLEYDPLYDLEVLAVVGVMPSILVCNKQTGFNSFNDLITSDKIIKFGFGGYGSSEHIATEILVAKTKVKSTMVPYAQGGSRSIADLIGGHIDCMFANYPTVKSQLKNENLLILMTSHSIGYNVPQWSDIYKTEFPFQSYLSIVIPSAAPQTLKNNIILDLKESFNNKTYRHDLTELGLFPLLITDKQLTISIVRYMESIKRFILENNIKISG